MIRILIAGLMFSSLAWAQGTECVTQGCDGGSVVAGSDSQVAVPNCDLYAADAGGASSDAGSESAKGQK